MPENEGEPVEARAIEDGIALCLSGGGYRAMVFHVGVLWRLNEAKLLKKLNRISSVSGGSITSATLALHWGHLDFDDDGFARGFGRVVDRIRGMAGVTIDRPSILKGLLLPGRISDRIGEAYDKHLFAGASLQDIPHEVPGKSPRFVINATNVQSGALWRFSRKYMADYRVGRIDLPDVSLAEAVTASSAFPPFLSPVKLDIRQPVVEHGGADLHREPYISKAVLSDGGVYDNLGLETALGRYRTILASNGGKKLAPEERPAGDWARHILRILFVIDNQVGSQRRRHLIEKFVRRDEHDGVFWGIGTDFGDYKLAEDPLGCGSRDPGPLAGMSTRLKAMDDVLQEKLINWGYAITDAGLRAFFDEDMQRRYDVSIDLPKGFPYARGY
ncbi:MAG: patatin-like phospholipase family protein [Geminicoccaceae bacterium]